jgi:hypothetical protein
MLLRNLLLLQMCRQLVQLVGEFLDFSFRPDVLPFLRVSFVLFIGPSFFCVAVCDKISVAVARSAAGFVVVSSGAQFTAGLVVVSSVAQSAAGLVVVAPVDVAFARFAQFTFRISRFNFCCCLSQVVLRLALQDVLLALQDVLLALQGVLQLAQVVCGWRKLCCCWHKLCCCWRKLCCCCNGCCWHKYCCCLYKVCCGWYFAGSVAVVGAAPSRQ